MEKIRLAGYVASAGTGRLAKDAVQHYRQAAGRDEFQSARSDETSRTRDEDGRERWRLGPIVDGASRRAERAVCRQPLFGSVPVLVRREAGGCAVQRCGGSRGAQAYVNAEAVNESRGEAA